MRTKNATAEVRKYYDVKDFLLGEGAFGKVFLASSKTDENAKYAIKILPLAMLSKSTKTQMEQEICVLNKLDHPYVARYAQSFQDEKYIYIIMPLIPGQELFNWMEEQGKVDEVEACKIMYKILLGVNHVHKQGVIHRDLKPENIMIDDQGEPKIIDFGLSLDTVTEGIDTRRVGSLIFMAPEIIEGFAHTSACDIWSLGIILFMMLSGSYPFNLNNIEKEITDTPLLFLGPTWDEVSHDCKDLLLKMLTKDPGERISAQDALSHPWMRLRSSDAESPEKLRSGAIPEEIGTPHNLDKNTIQHLLDYRGMSLVRMAGINVLVSMLQKKDIDPLRVLFEEMDKDKTGFITPEELAQAISQSEIQLDSEQQAEILKNVDVHRNGKINYSEFLAATISIQEFLTEEKLWMIFRHFDIDDTDFISRDNIVEAMRRMGKRLTEEEVDESLKVHDICQDGKISFAEFRHMFFPNEDFSPSPTALRKAQSVVSSSPEK